MADFPIVGIGSSAGGLEAMQKLFNAMPPDGGLAFIIAAHLDPTQKSHLTELLSRCTKMPVVQIENSIKVEPDHVYVMRHPCDRYWTPRNEKWRIAVLCTCS